VVVEAEVGGVHVHSAVVGPVVRQGDNEFDADVRGRNDDLVELGDVDGRRTVGPPLEDSFGIARAFVAVLGIPIRIVCDVLVVEAPCTEDFESCFFAGRHALHHVVLGL
jgi:hypothetical protein